MTLLAKTAGDENVAFFQELNFYMNSIRDLKLSNEVISFMLEAWIKGFAAGARK